MAHGLNQQISQAINQSNTTVEDLPGHIEGVVVDPNTPSPRDVAVDIVIGYSDETEAVSGSQDLAIATINLYFSIANAAYKNSGTGVRLNLKELVRLEMEPVTSQYAEHLDFLQATEDLSESWDNYDETKYHHVLLKKRHELKADLAAVFVEVATYFVCGVADIDGFISTQAITCPAYVFGHEVGHNFGLHHHRYPFLDSQTLNGYGFGYAKEGDFYTVMSYGCRWMYCPQIPYFSNPDITYNGQPMGMAHYNSSRYVRGSAVRIQSLYTSDDLPQITQQPQGGHLDRGDNPLQLSVAATSLVSLTYEWYKDEVLVEGETGPTLSVTFPIDNRSHSERHTYYAKAINPSGFVDSDKVEVTFTTDIQITVNPSPLTILQPGQLTRLRVQATSSSSSALSYQWYKNGVLIPNKNDTDLLIDAAIQGRYLSFYYVEISNSMGETVRSNDSETRNLGYRINITQQPIGGSIGVGEFIDLTVEIEYASTYPLSYQWFKDDMAISGANQKTLRVTNSQDTVISIYYLAIYEDPHVNSIKTSSNVEVRFTGNQINITQQPQDGGVVPLNGTLELSVAATTEAGLPLSYQWYRTVIFGGSTLRLIEEAIHPTLTLSQTMGLRGDFEFRVKVSNPAIPDGAVYSNTVTVRFLRDLEISQQPQGGAISAGGSLTLSLGVTKSPAITDHPLTYTWWKNGIQIDGEANSTLTVTCSSQNRHISNYQVIVTASGTSPLIKAISEAAQVTCPEYVNQPIITVDLKLSGYYILREDTEPLSFGVVANSPTGEALGYQWYKDGVALSGETSSSITLTHNSHYGADIWYANYQVEAFSLSNPSSSARSRNVPVYFFVNAVEITKPPMGGHIPIGGTLTLSVEARIPSRPNAVLRYQWYRNFSTIVGATDQTYVANDIEIGEWGKSPNDGYYVRAYPPNTIHGHTPSNIVVVSYERTKIEITEQPRGGAVNLTSPLQLRVAAEQRFARPNDLEYQWYRNGYPMHGKDQQVLNVEASSFSGTIGEKAIYQAGITYLGRGQISNQAHVTFVDFGLDTKNQATQENEIFSYSLANLIYPAPDPKYSIQLTDDGGSGVIYQDSDQTLRGTALTFGHYIIRGTLSDGSLETSWSFKLAVAKDQSLPLSKVSAGTHHTCAITNPEGEVSCWGLGTDGQLGQGTLDSTSYPVAVRHSNGSLFSEAIQVAVGRNHSCALTLSGEIQCWGRGSEWQLGQSTNISSNSPLSVLDLESGIPLNGVVQISLGEEHGCALVSNGGVKCWGASADGQLGYGTQSPSSAGATLVIKEEGSPLSGVIQVDVGDFHSCALSARGRVYCWGLGDSGQLGDGKTKTSPHAVLVSRTSSLGEERSLASIIQISAGGKHTCALTNSQKVKCWGDKTYGQLGFGFIGGQNRGPVNVLGEHGSTLGRITKVTAGSYHTCAQKTSGKVWCWGIGENGELGVGPVYDIQSYPSNRVTTNKTDSNGDPEPFSGVIQLHSSGSHTCALLDEGEIRCWGLGTSGQIGNNKNRRKNGYPTLVKEGANSSRPLTINTDEKVYTCRIRKEPAISECNLGSSFIGGTNGN